PATSRPWATRATAKSSSARTARAACNSFLFCAKTKCLAEAQIQREAGRTCCFIDGDNRLTRHGDDIEAAIGGILHSGSTRRAGAEGRARVVCSVSIRILSGGDVKGRAGTSNQE